MRARGKHLPSAASARWVPIPVYEKSFDRHCGQTAGRNDQPPQM
jgi:hypothetical protein